MKKKVLIALGVVAVIIVAIVGYFVTKDLGQEKILIEEINEIAQKDIVNEDVNTEIKTKGDYAVVERKIKEYLSEFGQKAKTIQTMLEDENIAKVLSADNYKEDGPEFTKTKEYISTTKTNFNENMDRLIEMCKEDVIMENIKQENLDEYYVNLYETLMFDEEVKKDLQDTGATLQESSDSINELLNIQTEIIDLLANNADTWSINSNNQIEFTSQSMLNQYNALVQRLSSL